MNRVHAGADRRWHPQFAFQCVAVGAVAAAWMGWLVRSSDAEAKQLVSNVGLTTIGLAAGLICLRKGIRARGRPRVAWRLFGLAALSWAMGQAIWTWYESVLGREVPFPSAADIGYLGFVPLTVVALLALPAAPERLASRVRIVLDGLVIAGSLLFVSWATVLGTMYREGTGSWISQSISLAYPVGDVLTISILLFAIVRSRRQGLVPRLTLFLLSAGLIFFAISDSGFAYLTSKDLYASGGLIDGGWFLGFSLLMLAGLRPTSAATPRPRQEAPERRSAVLLPYAAVVLAVSVAAFRQLTADSLDPFLVWNTVALILLVVLRQVLSVLENLSLTKDLEARVQDRTAELHQSEQRFRSLVQNSSDVISLVDGDGVITYQSTSGERVFGYRPCDLLQTRLMDLVHPDDRVRVAETLARVAGRSSMSALVEFPIRHSSGAWCQTETTVTNMLSDPSVNGLVLNTRDIGERKSLENELVESAFHDSLTHLANRALFKSRLEHALAQYRRHGLSVAVLFLDLDGFKNVNDSLGHAYGDHVLAEVAERLVDCVREADTVARLGGDEFGILLEGLGGHQEVDAVALRVCAALRQPLVDLEREVFVAGSVGIAQAETGDETADDLLRNADLAMYKAKAERAGTYRWYEPAMHASVVERAKVEADLRRASERGEFYVEYQPIVDLRSGRVTGAEALVRWEHPTRGRIAPADFIPVAESNGLVVPIGEWVLGEACGQLHAWQQDHPGVPLSMNVNLSARQLQRNDLFDVLQGALACSGVDPANLVLEMTESILIEQQEGTLETLRRLKALGIQLAVDDFGTGYSSLSYLHRLPVDIIKIDRSFVERLTPQSDETGLAPSIVRIGQSLRLTTVAEGIEEQHQLDALRLIGCEFGQGYLFAAPLAADDFAACWLSVGVAPALD